jgi:hypothetical protein
MQKDIPPWVVYSSAGSKNKVEGIRMRRLLITALATLFILSGCGEEPGSQAWNNAPSVEAAQISSKAFGDYVLHFNAISTDKLQPEVARAYNIARSKSRAMLNISIVKNSENGLGSSVPGTVNVSAANLTGQIKNLTLRKIQEGDAIYYIGDVSVANGETLVFDIDAIPEDETTKFSVRFSRQFFPD